MYRLSAQPMLIVKVHVIIKAVKLCTCRGIELIMEEYLIILLRMLVEMCKK